MRSQEKSRPGDLNGAPRGQAERGLGDFSSENIAQEVQNVMITPQQEKPLCRQGNLSNLVITVKYH